MHRCESEVSECPIFRDLLDFERDALLQRSEIMSYDTGVSIIREGNSFPHGVWAVRSGHCEVVHECSIVGEKQVNFLHSGAIFGEISFFDPQRHSATVRVVEPAEMLFISCEAIKTLQEECPTAAFKFILNMGRIVSQKFRSIDRRLLNELVVTASPAG